MPAKPPAKKTYLPGISCYPNDESRLEITRIANELDCTEGKVIALCAEAVIEMLAGPKLVVPRLVEMLRVSRKHDATLLDAPKPWPTGTPKRKA